MRWIRGIMLTSVDIKDSWDSDVQNLRNDMRMIIHLQKKCHCTDNADCGTRVR